MINGFSNNWAWKGHNPKIVAKPSFSKPKKKKKAAARKKHKIDHEKRKAEMNEAREALKKHYTLQRYPTDMAICLCIHNEYGLEMPENDKQAKKMIFMFWKRLTGSLRGRKYSLVPADKFYASAKWKEVRYIALQQGGGKCCLCGAMARDGVSLHVDHIKPRSLFPEMGYELSNLQILCSDCNMGKSNYDDTDWKQHWDEI
mgnify:CR=1 FL=1